ncbi:MAG: hypothetical protein IT173_13220 [Acidobacteria bacterium]|nr:hypothetical protein [Acidobacteriota bacterium]
MKDGLRKSDWEAHPVGITTARRLIEKYHYAAGASNTATYLHGLFKKGDIFDEQCVGVTWWIPPTKSAGQATYPADPHGVLCLSRLVIEPTIPKNAATFLLARSRKLIDRFIWPCLVTYADKWRGHSGAIYRADNWDYVGETKPQPCYTINGRLTSRKAGPKTRTHAEMLALGAEFLGMFPKHKFRRLGR